MVGICLHIVLANQAPVVQTEDNSIHWINHYPVDSIIHPLKTVPSMVSFLLLFTDTVNNCFKCIY